MNWLQLGSVTTALVAGLAVLVAASTVADRMGAPVGVIEYAALILALAGIGLSAVTTRTMRPGTFRMGGGDMGWIRSVAPLVLIGYALVARPFPYPGMSPGVTGVAAGLVIVAMLFAAPMHRAGVSGLGVFALVRYRSRGLCVLAGLATIAVALSVAYVAIEGATAGFVSAFALPPRAAQVLAVALALVLALPGGMASATAGAVAVLAITAVGYALPATVLVMRPEPGLAGLQSALGAALGSDAPSPVAMFAVAALFVYLGFIVTARKPGQARQVFVWSAVIIVALSTAALVVSRATDQAGASLVGQPVDRLPAQLYAPAARGIVEVCGVPLADPVEVRRACAARGVESALTAPNLSIRTERARWVALAIDVPAIGTAILALVLPLGLIVLLATSARAAAAAFVDEVMLPLLPRNVTASAQLALHRLAIGLAIGFAAAITGPLRHWLDAMLRHADLAFPAAIMLISLPAILVFPARASAADWRVPAVLLVIAMAVAAAIVTGWLPATPELAGMAIVLLGVLAAAAPLLLPVRAPYDIRAAEIVAGRLREPIIAGRDP